MLHFLTRWLAARPGARRPRRVRLLGVGALALGVAGAPAGAQRVQKAVAPAASRAAAEGRVVVDTLWSPALGARKQFVVYLPPAYRREPARRFPVLYYLHGLWGSEWDWVRQGGLDVVADSLARAGQPQAIVVMPDGDDGWYTTWGTLGTAQRCEQDTVRARRESAASYCVPWARYDDYVARDLVARVDSAYRTLPVRAHRAVAGLSMGGYGATALALGYPDVFAAAASHSGVVAPLFAGAADFAGEPPWAPSVAVLAERWRGYWTTIPLAFGPDTAGWWSRDPARLAARVQRERPALLPALHVDVGTADVTLGQNRAFRHAMRALGVPLTYREWPGAHDWRYWRAHVGESMAWLARHVAPGERAS